MNCGEDLKERLGELQEMMKAAADGIRESGRAFIIVFEGLDASGKSGCIKRITKPLDPFQYSVIPTAKPTAEQYRYHYLKRFWDTLPEYGKIAVYDRSWYGRVLVERVEGYAAHSQWNRAYREINAFEKLLYDDGAVIVKLWLDISEEEQFQRFMERKNNPKKAHKLTEEDWRNRAKRPMYDEAAADMLRLTSTPYAPWTVIDADSKPEARVRVLETILSAAELML